jgi:hypothetical protein
VTLTLPPQMIGDPRGWLCFTAPLPDPDMQRAEDGTQYHDRSHGGTFTRPATNTERTLLTALGYTLPDNLSTCVRFLGPLRQRRWPQLETEGLT